MIIIISEWYLQLWEMCIGKGTKFLHQRNIRNQATDNSFTFIYWLFIYLFKIGLNCHYKPKSKTFMTISYKIYIMCGIYTLNHWMIMKDIKADIVATSCEGKAFSGVHSIFRYCES